VKRTTLLVIAQILKADRPLTSQDVIVATELMPSEVRQIMKRLTNEGWLLREVRPGQTRARRYRLTSQGRREGREALQRQADLVGGKWLIRVTREMPPRPQQKPSIGCQLAPIDVFESCA
jgi:DNA-binding MarR family transcriptional regulator